MKFPSLVSLALLAIILGGVGATALVMQLLVEYRVSLHWGWISLELPAFIALINIIIFAIVACIANILVSESPGSHTESLHPETQAIATPAVVSTSDPTFLQLLQDVEKCLHQIGVDLGVNTVNQDLTAATESTLRENQALSAANKALRAENQSLKSKIVRRLSVFPGAP
ncbi:hypothetical protein C8R46DRAFT_1081086 [Mycena filopes]|nr:hypothetical protein C8R46DRAFT_1081086 [Mycena filopes]